MVDRDATGRIDMRRIGTEAIVDVDAASPGCRGGGGRAESQHEEVCDDGAVVVERDGNARVGHLDVPYGSAEACEDARAVIGGETFGHGSAEQSRREPHYGR